MAKSRLFMICIIASLFCYSLAFANPDGPFIIAHKKASLTRLKSGSERVSVSIDITNHGSGAAYDVSLNDDNWSQDLFEAVGGNTSTSWERLDIGATVSHSFELEAKQKTVYYGSPAVITFRVPTKSALQEAYSTPIMPLDILADRTPEKKLDLVSFPKVVGQIWILGISYLHCCFVRVLGRSTKVWCSQGKQEKALIIYYTR
ncbi:membrane traffic protein [Lithospermum erythrorhizon]|uniref:Membrane traffic protein n=1 Tax=Lithospermum erythrorhizon TaxID=34254 RepID=A0AAV3NQX3_LITER